MELIKYRKVLVKIIVSILLVVLSLWISSFSSSFQYNKIKDNGKLQQQLTKKLKEVTGIWVSVKIAGGIISVVQTIQVEGSIPVVGGLAVSAQPLGWADVIDNTLDYISNVCLWAMGALAVQKVLLAVSIWVSLRIGVPICALFIILAVWSKKYAGQLKRIIAGIIIISLGICLAIPLSLGVSGIVEASILSSYVDETVNEINSTSKEIEEEGSQANDVDWLRKIGSGITGFFISIKSYFDSLIEKAVNYIICFVVTNIIIPIGTLFFLKYLISATLKFIGFSGAGRVVQQESNKVQEIPADV